MAKRFGYLFGNAKKRKYRSPLFDNEAMRNMYAAADKSLGYRVRKYSKTTKKGKKVI